MSHTDPTRNAPRMGPKSNRRSRMGYLWAVGLCLYLAVLWYVGWQNIRQALLSFDIRFLAALMAVEALAVWIRAAKWRMVLGPGQNALGAYLVSKAAGSLSPARTGELAPLLFKRHRNTRMGAWILVDRLLETGATLGLGLLGLMAMQLPRRDMAVVVAVALVLLVVAPFYILTRRGLFVWFARRTNEQSIAHRAAALLTDVSGQVFRLGKKLPAASFITLTATCLDICVSSLAYLGFGYHVPFALLAIVQCVHGLVSALPFTPNATGVPYLVAMGLIYEFADVPAEVLAVAVAVRTVGANIVFWTSFGLGSRHLPAREKKT